METRLTNQGGPLDHTNFAAAGVITATDGTTTGQSVRITLAEALNVNDTDLVTQFQENLKDGLNQNVQGGQYAMDLKVLTGDGQFTNLQIPNLQALGESIGGINDALSAKEREDRLSKASDELIGNVVRLSGASGNFRSAEAQADALVAAMGEAKDTFVNIDTMEAARQSVENNSMVALNLSLFQSAIELGKMVNQAMRTIVA